jgi:hypothetical protein
MCAVRVFAAVLLGALLGVLAPVRAGPWIAGPFVRREPEITEASLVWQKVFTLRAAGGWRDNALLAGTNVQSTPFVGAGLEFFLFRLPVDEHRFSLILTGDDRRYLRHVEPSPEQPPAEGETVFATQADYRRLIGERFSVSLVGQHLYADQVFDASTLADGTGSVQSTVHSLSAHPSLRWNPLASLRLDAGFQWQRQNFDAPLDGFWSVGPRILAGWDYRANSSLELAWRLEDRPYDSRPAANLLGIPEPGTVAHFTQQHAELAWRHRWHERLRIRSTLRLFYLGNRDEEVGFYDFDRLGVAAQLQMDWAGWTASTGVRWSHWDYARQFVSPAPEDLFRYRRRDDLELTVRLQRRFGTHLSVFVEELFEKQESNVTLETFHSHTVQGGLEWEF